jgi:hypothetical protein
MSLGLVISGVGDIVDGLGGSLCGFAQPVFELGEELLDRVQIGRVFRQVEEPSARRHGWRDARRWPCATRDCP